MVSRRRRDVVVFDLEESGAPRTADGPSPSGTGHPGAVSDEVTAPPADAARRPARRFREAAVAGAVVVLAVAAWGVTTTVHEHQREQRLLTAPGGVLSLADPPATAWTAGTDGADATAFMPGLVVVRRGTALVGLDAATGEPRWQAEVGGDPVCGLSLWGRGTTAAVVDPLVCWSGPNAAHATVTVVHADGEASTRDLADPFAGAAGTADGGLVTVRRIGAVPPPPDAIVTPVPSGGYDVAGSVTQGQDVAVRLEDAVTGTVRWERTIPFRPVPDAVSCGIAVHRTDEGGELATVDTAQVGVSTYPGLVVVQGCGIQGAFALDGTPMSDTTASAWSWAEPYVDGGVLEQVGAYTPDAEATSLLHGPDGAGVTTFPVPVLQPAATDGTSSDLVLTGSAGEPLQGRGRDGTLRWQAAHPYTAVGVRTSGVIPVLGSDGGVAALDPRTGAELWSEDGVLSGDPAAGSPGYVMSAFTDGSVAMLAVVRNDTSSSTELVAVDLATGDVRWRTPAAAGWPFLTAVHGRLVEVVGGQGSRLDSDGAGGTIRTSPGTVTAFE